MPNDSLRVHRSVIHRLAAAAWLILAAPALSAQQPAPTLALVGGRVIDGYGGPVIENGVILVAGERIIAVGRAGEVNVPAGVTVISTEGMTVLPGLFDMHVHIHLLGHADYRRWNELYGRVEATEVMPVAARQLLMAGVTSARDLGAELEPILEV